MLKMRWAKMGAVVCLLAILSLGYAGICSKSNNKDTVTGSSGEVPITPTNLTALAVSPSRIDLSWTDSSTNEAGFRIERKTGIGTYAQIGQVPQDVATYKDNASDLLPATLYYYRVKAFNSVGDSGYSNVVSATTAAWRIEIVDAATVIHQRSSNSLAIAPDNSVHISYVNDTNKDLMYANNSSGSWQTSTVDSAPVVDYYTSIAVDRNSKIHFSYHDYLNGTLRYANNISGSWTAEVVDQQASNYVGRYSAIALDPNNRAHIAYCVAPNNPSMKYVNNTSGSWAITTFESASATFSNPAIVVDKNNKVHIAYTCYTTSDGKIRLKYMTNASGNWIITAIDIDNGSVIFGSVSIAVDSNIGVHIIYRRSSDNAVVYATNSSGSWQTEVVAAGISGVLASLTLDFNGKPHVVYANAGDLIYANKVAGNWEFSTIENIGQPALGETGNACSIKMDGNDKVHISYIYYTNQRLKYASNR